MGIASIGLHVMWPMEASAASQWKTIFKIVSGVGTVAGMANEVMAAIQNVKALLPKVESEPEPGLVTPLRMQPFQPQVQDSFNGGQQWLSQLQDLARQNGNSWVPTSTRGLSGVNLMGIWSTPGLLAKFILGSLGLISTSSPVFMGYPTRMLKGC